MSPAAHHQGPHLHHEPLIVVKKFLCNIKHRRSRSLATSSSSRPGLRFASIELIGSASVQEAETMGNGSRPSSERGVSCWENLVAIQPHWSRDHAIVFSQLQSLSFPGDMCETLLLLVMTMLTILKVKDDSTDDKLKYHTGNGRMLLQECGCITSWCYWMSSLHTKASQISPFVMLHLWWKCRFMTRSPLAALRVWQTWSSSTGESQSWIEKPMRKYRDMIRNEHTRKEWSSLRVRRSHWIAKPWSLGTLKLNELTLHYSWSGEWLCHEVGCLRL